MKAAPTGVKEETLVHIGNRFSSPPPNAAEFIIHKGLLRILHARKDMVDNKVVDWAMGEAMAFGSLLKEGKHHLILDRLDSNSSKVFYTRIFI